MAQENENRVTNMAQSLADMAERMTRLNNETMMAGVRGMQPWLDAYGKLFSSMMPAVQPAKSKCCNPGCCIPETECPPYRACTLEWTLTPGDTRVGSIEIQNTSREPIGYSLAATPLISNGRTTETRPQLEPSSGKVEPGASLQVRVSVTADKSWVPGETYQADIKVRGKYERAVGVRVEVARQPEVFCRMELGEIPKRVHADNWTNHFQCTELCFEPIDPAGRQPVPQ
jgi:hypothetical protein